MSQNSLGVLVFKKTTSLIAVWFDLRNANHFSKQRLSHRSPGFHCYSVSALNFCNEYRDTGLAPACSDLHLDSV